MYLSTGKIEKAYGVSKYIVKTWIKAGKIRFIITEGNQYRVEEEDVKVLLGVVSTDVG